MPIPATTPTSLPAGDYDRWATASFLMYGSGCATVGEAVAAPITLVATGVKARVRPDGVWEESPKARDRFTVRRADLEALAAADPDVAAAVAALAALIAKFAAQDGVL